MPQVARKSGDRGGKAGGGAGGTGGRNNDADEAMADAAAELEDLSAALDGDRQAGRASLPDRLLQRRLDKQTAEKENETTVEEKAIKE
jgi:hypothetical protein